MNDIFLLLLFVAAFAVAWIEWIPERYGIFPKLLLSLVVVTIGIGWIPAWYGWVVLSIGIAQLVWAYFSPKRRKEWPKLFSGPASVRTAAGAVSAVVLSPIAALPSVLLLSVILVTWDALFGNASQVAGDLQEAAKQVLGRSFVAIVATADLFFRNLLISGPLLFAGGYATAAYSIGSGVFWQRYSRGLLLFGTIYPIVFIAAVTFRWFEGPFFN